MKSSGKLRSLNDYITRYYYALSMMCTFVWSLPVLCYHERAIEVLPPQWREQTLVTSLHYFVHTRIFSAALCPNAFLLRTFLVKTSTSVKDDSNNNTNYTSETPTLTISDDGELVDDNEEDLVPPPGDVVDSKASIIVSSTSK